MSDLLSLPSKQRQNALAERVQCSQNAGKGRPPALVFQRVLHSFHTGLGRYHSCSYQEASIVHKLLRTAYQPEKRKLHDFK